MRDIKFRAWDTISEIMLLPGIDKLYITLVGIPCSTDERKDGSEFIERRLYRLRLMQYTGLKDSTKWESLTKKEKQNFMYPNGKTARFQNEEKAKKAWKGKEIYEGDVVESTYFGELFIVKFYEGEFVGDNSDFKFGILSYYELKESEVIGNIHENPELLTNS